MTPDRPDAGVLLDSLREDRRDPHLLERFGVGWAEDLGVDDHDLWVSVAGFRLRRIRAGECVVGHHSKPSSVDSGLGEIL